jgi:hypothetical protein
MSGSAACNPGLRRNQRPTERRLTAPPLRHQTWGSGGSCGRITASRPGCCCAHGTACSCPHVPSGRAAPPRAGRWSPSSRSGIEPAAQTGSRRCAPRREARRCHHPPGPRPRSRRRGRTAGRSRATAAKSDVITAKSQSESSPCVPRDRDPANSTRRTAGWLDTSSVALRAKSATKSSSHGATGRARAAGAASRPRRQR